VDAKCWDQIVEDCLIPNMEKNVKVNKQVVVSEVNKEDGNKCTGFLPLGESPGGLFIGVVRGSGNNVRTPPLTTSFMQRVQS
jgi:hypothetical protein